MKLGAWVNRLCAVLVVSVFCFCFAAKGLPLYYSGYASLKAKISGNFDLLTQENAMRDVLHRILVPYMKLPNGVKRYYGVTMINDGRLMTNAFSYAPFFEERTAAITSLNNYFKSKDIPMLFVRIPNKLRDESQLPIGELDTTITEGDRFAKALRSNGVDTLDLREEMINDNMDFVTGFYRADHHWTNETALYAWGKVGARMNSDYGFDLDERTWNPEEYYHELHPDLLYGSEAGILQNWFLDDVTNLIPKFHTKFKIDSHEYPFSEGTYREIFIKDDLTNAPEGKYKSLTATEHKKVLIIIDSHGRSFMPFAACAVENTELIFLGAPDIYSTIKDEDYDMVLFMLSEVVITRGFGESFRDDRVYLGEIPQ